MKKRGSSKDREKSGGIGREVESEQLEPVGVVERELTSPDGSTVIVEVPVYPPFKLKQRKPAKPARRDRIRKAS